MIGRQFEHIPDGCTMRYGAKAAVISCSVM